MLNDKVLFARVLTALYSQLGGIDLAPTCKKLGMDGSDLLGVIARAQMYWVAVRALPHSKTRRVEYYRCWPGNGSDRGAWDTDFIEIPSDTPTDHLDAAVRAAAEKVVWNDQPPAFVGHYAGDDSNHGEEDDNLSFEGDETGGTDAGARE